MRHSQNAIFAKNVTCLAKFAQVMRKSGKWRASGHCLLYIQKNIYCFYHEKRYRIKHSRLF
jgi:hypothetical protein